MDIIKETKFRLETIDAGKCFKLGDSCTYWMVSNLRTRDTILAVSMNHGIGQYFDRDTLVCPHATKLVVLS